MFKWENIVVFMGIFLFMIPCANASEIQAMPCSDLQDYLSSVSDYDFTEREFFDDLSKRINTYYTPIGQELSKERIEELKTTEGSKFNLEEIRKLDISISWKLSNFSGLINDLALADKSQPREVLLAPFWFGTIVNSERQSNTALQTIDVSFFKTRDSYNSKRPEKKIHMTHQWKFGIFFNDYEDDATIIKNYQKTLPAWSIDAILLELYIEGYFKDSTTDWKLFRDFSEWYIRSVWSNISIVKNNSIYMLLASTGIERTIIRQTNKKTNQEEMFIWWADSYSWSSLSLEKKWLIAEKIWALPPNISIKNLREFDAYSEKLKWIELDTKKEYSVVRFKRIISDRFSSNFFTGSPWDVILRHENEIKEMLIANCWEEEKKFYADFWKEPPKRGINFLVLLLLLPIIPAWYWYWTRRRELKSDQ